MSKIETTASNVGIKALAANDSPDLHMLRDDESDTVSGGFLSNFFIGDYFKSQGDSGVLGQIVSPRDPASGLPTGK